MKLIVKLFSTVVLTAAMSSAFSANLTCPSIQEIRTKVQLQRAAMLDQNKFMWGLASNVFTSGDATWNVLLITTLAIYDPTAAVYQGQEFFDHSILVNPTPVSGDGHKNLTCQYSLEAFNYTVQAVSPANYGFNK